jgi:hypothetical protein
MMTSQGAERGVAAGDLDARGVGGGDRISAAVLRDFLLACLRHDALHDAVIEGIE